jgi:hypothetical protein
MLNDTILLLLHSLKKESDNMSTVQKFCSIAILLLFSAHLFAQVGIVRGNVYDKETGEPVIYCNVYLDGTTSGATTDLDGFFTIPNVPVGDYDLLATYIGYDTVSAPIVISEKKIAYQSLYLDQSGVELGVVNISAAKEQARSTVQISKISVSPRQIKALPSTGGEADIAQYLQIIPGVIATGDQGGQIYIRGGSPVQNKILLDGLNIYNPFHSIVFFSVFETELIRNVDVLTGGFGAEHGGRISAVVDIQTRSGNKKRLSGQASASPFMGKLLLEGPLTKYKEGGTDVTFVLSGKQSIIDETSQTLYPYASENDSIGLPFNFRDLYGKVSINTKNGSRFNFFGFDFSDQFNNPRVADVGWENQGGGFNFKVIPVSSNIVFGGLIGVTQYAVGIDEDDGRPRNSDISEITAAIDFSIFGENNSFNYGLELRSISTNFEFVNPFNERLDQVQNTTEIGGFFKYKQIIGDLIIEPSVRYQYYASLSTSAIEPRFGIKYNISEDMRFKAAGGIYTQNLLSTDTERDVVNLFNGFLTGPETDIEDLDGTLTKEKIQRSRHLVAGLEKDIGSHLQVNVEGYYKDFPHLVVVNRNKIDAGQSDYSVEVGDAYGLDFSAKYERGPLYLWATYSIGKVQRFDGRQEFPTIFDRRHNVNLLGTYAFGNKKSWEASARWNFGTGFPFTQTRGFFNDVAFADGVGTDVNTTNPDNVGIIYSTDRNGGRLPSYHRMDVSVTKKIDITKRFGVDIVASVTNVYDRRNIFYFDRVEYDRVDQLPIIPSIAVKARF